MRLHIDIPNPLNKRAKVYYNGRELRNCIEADEERGYIEQYIVSCGIPLRHKDGTVKTRILRGNVKIVDPLKKD